MHFLNFEIGRKDVLPDKHSLAALCEKIATRQLTYLTTMQSKYILFRYRNFYMSYIPTLSKLFPRQGHRLK